MNGSGVSVLEICSAISSVEGIRTGQGDADTGLEEGIEILRQTDSKLRGFSSGDESDEQGADAAEDKTLQAMTTITRPPHFTTQSLCNSGADI
jgi:hypothetical protein